MSLKNILASLKETGDNINVVLNDNWRVIYDDMKAPIQTALGAAFRNIANRVSEKVSWDRMWL